MQEKRKKVKYFYQGEYLTVKELAIKLQLNYNTLGARLRKGWDLTDYGNRIIYQGQSLTTKQWSEKTGLSQRLINERLRNGWTVEKVFETPRNNYPDRR